MNLLKNLTLSNRGLRYKLLVAFSLMSIIPLLACMYVISNYVFPQVDNLFTVSAVVIVSIVLAILGLTLARGLVDPVIVEWHAEAHAERYPQAVRQRDLFATALCEDINGRRG